MNELISPLPWRFGRKVGRTLYDARDQLIGLMDSGHDALFIVRACNAHEELLDAAHAALESLDPDTNPSVCELLRAAIKKAEGK